MFSVHVKGGINVNKEGEVQWLGSGTSRAYQAAKGGRREGM